MHRFFLVWVIALGCAQAATTVARPNVQSYEAVIDAGSSGSRLYLYERQSGPDGPKVTLLLEDKPKHQQGLSKYADNPEQAGVGEIRPLLAGLADFAQTNGIDPTAVTVSVLATAGMRLVEPSIANRIHESVRQEIVSQGYAVRQIGTISGQDEGLYAWTALNDLKGNLRTGRETEGIVEVGGASAQVAFAVPLTVNRDAAVRRVRIGELDYAVFSRSFLGLGQNEARRSMVQTVTAQGLAQNPCYPNSTSPNVSFDVIKSGRSHASLRVPGQDADFSLACFDVYLNVIQKTSASPTNGFALNRFQSTPGFRETRFVLVGSFYYKLRDWHLLEDRRPGRRLLTELLSRCVGDNAWQTVSSYQGEGFFAQNACANATYLYTLIFSGKGLALSSSRVEVLDAVNEEPLTWTRGFAILAAGS